MQTVGKENIMANPLAQIPEQEKDSIHIGEML